MYIVDAFLSIIPGNEAKAYAALGALAETVERSEPGTWMYLFHTPNFDPGINIFPPPAPVQVLTVEGYASREAFLEHRDGPVMKEFFARYGSLFLNMYGPQAPFIILQCMELTNGFIRPEAADPNVFQVEARWSMVPDSRQAVKDALVPYVKAVYEQEPLTYMYTVSMTDIAPDAPSIPPLQQDQLTFNSSWKDHDAFVEHTKNPVYQDFLKASGFLFVQAEPGTTHPYMTTSVMKRFAGFFRQQAFFK